MGSFFNMDGKFFSFMTRVADLMILNILWIICCIPIVTIGASTTALYYVTMKMAKNEESYIVKSFFRSFKENFKQSTILWLITLIIGIIFTVDLKILRYLMPEWGKLLTYPIYVLLIFYLFILSYLFPLQAKFINTIKNTIKNALLMSIRHLPMTVLILIITIAPFLLIIFVPQLFSYGVLIFILIGFALIAFANSFLFTRIFNRYIPKENEEADTQVNE